MRLAEPAFAGFPFPADADDGPIPRARLAAWLDAAWGVGLDGATSRVAGWSSRGVANAATQATAARMPLLVPNGRKGQPTVRFDGADDELALAVALPPGPLSVFVAAMIPDTSAIRGILGAGAGVGWGYRHDPGGLNLTRQNEMDYLSNAGAAPGAWTVFGATWDGATIRHYKDGAPNGTIVGVTTVPSAATSQVGRIFDRSMLGDFGEIVIHARALSTAEAVGVQSYLKGRWG